MEPQKMILFMYVLYVHLLPSVTMFDLDFKDVEKWMNKIQNAEPLEFIKTIVQAAKDGDANGEVILDIVSQGAKIVNAFNPDDSDDSVSSANEPSRLPVRPVEPVQYHQHTHSMAPNTNSGQNTPNKVTLEVTRTDGGVRINDGVFIPDSQLNLAGRIVPDLKALLPGNSPPSTLRPTAVSNPENSEEQPITTSKSMSVRMPPRAPYFESSTTTVAPSTNNDHVFTSPERMRLEFTKTTDGYMFNDTLFIKQGHINLVRKMVQGFGTLFPNTSSNSSESLENQEKIILLVAKTGDGILINDTVVIKDDSLIFARDAVPWLNDIFPSHFGSEPKQAVKDQLKSTENSAVPKTHLISRFKIITTLTLLHVIICM